MGLSTTWIVVIAAFAGGCLLGLTALLVCVIVRMRRRSKRELRDRDKELNANEVHRVRGEVVGEAKIRKQMLEHEAQMSRQAAEAEAAIAARDEELYVAKQQAAILQQQQQQQQQIQMMQHQQQQQQQHHPMDMQHFQSYNHLGSQQQQLPGSTTVTFR